jgi:hypothetical protein
LVEDETGGNPMTAEKWVRSTLRQLSEALSTSGFVVGYVTVRRLLKSLGFSLKSNRKESTGPAHPDRDRQFRYIRRVKKCFQAAGHPIISVDAKKKELIGGFKNSGRAWCREAEAVNVHDFPQDAEGRAIPYGIYDITHNLGYVAVGTSSETSEFAVDAICWWWELEDRPTFPDESKLLIFSDAGGSEVMVCHYPTGASKWNPVEHRLFSYISLNWAGKPLRSFEAMLNYIRGTTTKAGLKVNACLMEREYKKGIKVSKQDMKALNLHRRRICPTWNYVIKPRCASP